MRILAVCPECSGPLYAAVLLPDESEDETKTIDKGALLNITLEQNVEILGCTRCEVLYAVGVKFRKITVRSDD